MSDTAPSIQRDADRHGHISIRLRLQHGDQWATIEALGWNGDGFNFYSGLDLAEPRQSFRRGLIPFEGVVTWTSRHASDETLRLMAVNESLFLRAKEVVHNHDLHRRLIQLLRAPGMLEQKCSVLATLGQPVDEAYMAAQVAKRRAELPLVHYGVKVESEAWRKIVAGALDISSVVQSLEQWSSAFTQR